MKLFKPIFKHWSYLADLVVIILGIIIALSLDAWWQNKQDRKREQEYLMSLYNDFAISLEVLYSDLNKQYVYRDDVIKILSTIHGEKEFNSDSIKIWLANGSNPSEIKLTDGTYNSLINSGNLNLITNEVLSNKLASYGSATQKEITAAKRQADVFNELAMTGFFMEEIGYFSIYSDSLKLKRQLPLSNNFPIDLKKLILDRRFNSFVTHNYILRKNNIEPLINTIYYTEEILLLLEAELGIEPTDSMSSE